MENQEILNPEKKNVSVVSVSDWMITMLLMCIPIVNIVMLFVWAFGSNTPLSKANWAKASLIWFAIGILFLILFWGTIGAVLLGNMN